MLAVLTLISAIAGLATLLAARQRGSSSVKAGADPDLLVSRKGNPAGGAPSALFAPSVCTPPPWFG